jgi:hypothetical protein
MYTNSTSYSSNYYSIMPESLPSLSPNSTVPVSRQVYGVFNQPQIRSKPNKYRGLPDQPDRAGMRARRTDSEMRISQLRQRTATDIKEKTTQKKVGKLSVFLDYFSKEFEIWRTSAAHFSNSNKGMTFIFGEKHDDPESKKTISAAMYVQRHDSVQEKFFMEGMFDDSCKLLVLGLKLRPEDCFLMEKDLEAFGKLDEMRETVLRKARECADFVRKELALGSDPLAGKVNYPSDYKTYINQHLDTLSHEARRKIDPMIATYNKLEAEWENFVRETMPIRDRYMAEKIRALRINNGPNFVVVGAAHLKGLREHLNDMPCVFMNPKHVVAEFPHTSLKEGPLNRDSKSL